LSNEASVDRPWDISGIASVFDSTLAICGTDRAVDRPRDICGADMGVDSPWRVNSSAGNIGRSRGICGDDSGVGRPRGIWGGAGVIGNPRSLLSIPGVVGRQWGSICQNLGVECAISTSSNRVLRVRGRPRNVVSATAHENDDCTAEQLSCGRPRGVYGVKLTGRLLFAIGQRTEDLLALEYGGVPANLTSRHRLPEVVVGLATQRGFLIQAEGTGWIE
jgi:hypothetical protein